ncbi:hypothetical protein JTL98_32555, partial [Pseudomonas aeruginosa]|nr:hypothetical protein [Pseudomonas aeruginosa]
SEESFETGAGLYSELLERFNDVPEQSNETLKKIFSGVNHRNVVKTENIEEMLNNLLLRMDLRQVFEGLRSKKSAAKPDTVETMFEEFVSFINGVVANFLPWILRALGKLSKFGSEKAAATDWSKMAKTIETALGARSGDTE